MAAAPASMLSLAVAARRPACVIDPALAFSPYGLLLAQRLSTEVELWVPRELWQILDNMEVYARRPEIFAPATPDEAEPDGGLRDAMRMWEVARAEQDLAGLRLYFIGDGLADSLLPAGEEGRLVHRFEALSRALEARLGHEAPADDALASCAREAAALAVALSPRGARILTTQPTRDRPPALCTLLEHWEIPTRDVTAHGGARLERDLLLAALARAGVAELAWAGLELAAVHVVARRAAAIPSFGAAIAPVGLDDDAVPFVDDEAMDWWSDACAFWYPLTLD